MPSPQGKVSTDRLTDEVYRRNVTSFLCGQSRTPVPTNNMTKHRGVVSLPFGEGGPQTLRLRWMRCPGTMQHRFNAGGASPSPTRPRVAALWIADTTHPPLAQGQRSPRPPWNGVSTCSRSEDNFRSQGKAKVRRVQSVQPHHTATS